MHEPGPRSDLPDAARSYAVTVNSVRDFAVILLDARGVIRSWNPAAAVMKGYAPEEVIGHHVEMLYPDDSRGAARRNLELAAAQGTWREEGWRRRKDGSLFWAMVEIIAICEHGKLVGFCKITQDFTERRALQLDLMAEKERAEVTLRAIGDGVICVDARGRIEMLNPAAEALTGWTEEEARGRPLEEVYRISVDPDTAAATRWPAEADASVTPAPLPALLTRRDGACIGIEENESPIHGEHGSVRGVVVVFRDVTALQGRLRLLAHQATHDALTGLVNRVEFERRLARALEHAHAGSRPGALIYFDLDRFKVVNDTCGHEAGDELLRRLARTYAELVRERDTLARLGGDEFALLVEQCTEEEAQVVAGKILDATDAFEFEYCGRTFHVGVSIGVTVFDHRLTSGQDVVQLADRACYLAKSGGRNRIRTATVH